MLEITTPSDEQIAQLAHSLWEQEGQPEGRAEEHWARAEEQLRNNGNAQDSDGSADHPPS